MHAVIIVVILAFTSAQHGRAVHYLLNSLFAITFSCAPPSMGLPSRILRPNNANQATSLLIWQMQSSNITSTGFASNANGITLCVAGDNSTRLLAFANNSGTFIHSPSFLFLPLLHHYTISITFFFTRVMDPFSTSFHKIVVFISYPIPSLYSSMYTCLSVKEVWAFSPPSIPRADERVLCYGARHAERSISPVPYNLSANAIDVVTAADYVSEQNTVAFYGLISNASASKRSSQWRYLVEGEFVFFKKKLLHL